nr:MAG TPA: hypothetical protein [Caudoviricetes sp.]
MKKETIIKQALKGEAEQEGAKAEGVKTVAVEQVAGIHVFSSDMEKPPIVLIDGECMDVAALLGFVISEFIDGVVAQGMQRADAERIAIETTKQAIVAARAEAFQKGEKH